MSDSKAAAGDSDDDLLKELGLESDEDVAKSSASKQKKRDRERGKASDEDMAAPKPKKPKTKRKKAMSDFIVEDDDDESSEEQVKKKRATPALTKPDFDMPEIDDVLKTIFGDSEDEKLGEFSSDEENFSDLSDIDEGVVPRAKKQIKALVTYHKKVIASSKKKGKPSRRRGGDDSDDGEVNMGDILPDGTKRRRRPVDDDLDGEGGMNQGEAPKRGNGKKMTEEEINARCVAFVEKMEQACHEDNESNRQKKPALKKMSLLEEAKQMMLREEWHENLLNAGILVVSTKWLSPLPDRTLPSVTIRDGILRALSSFNDITKYMLKESKIGSIVMFLSKNDPEPSLRKFSADLVQQWSRTLSSGSDSWQNLAEVERQRAAAGNDTRLSENAKRILSTQMAYGRKIQGSEPSKKVRGPQFASQPLVSTMDYLIRPESKIDVSTLVKKSASVRVFAKGTR